MSDIVYLVVGLCFFLLMATYARFAAKA